MLKLVLLFLGFCLSSSMALRCIACAHDPATAEMEDCVGKNKIKILLPSLYILYVKEDKI